MKQLFRSKTNRMLVGVCGGLGEYFNIDPSIVRLVTVGLCCAGGSGLMLYIVAAIIVPEEPTSVE